MPEVTIDWNAGRTDEQKNQIAEVITKALVEIGNAPEEIVKIEFIDNPALILNFLKLTNPFCRS